MGRKTYTPKFKFSVVLEVLKSEKSEAEVARADYPITPCPRERQGPFHTS